MFFRFYILIKVKVIQCLSQKQPSLLLQTLPKGQAVELFLPLAKIETSTQRQHAKETIKNLVL